MERLCISSFVKNGYQFELYSYQSPTDVPDGATLRDAREILPEKKAFLLYGSWSSFSDHFRYELMARRSGWWTDLDVVCLQRLPMNEYVFLTEHGIGTNWPTNAVFRVPWKSELMFRCKTLADQLPAPNPSHANTPVLWHGDRWVRGFCDAGWEIFQQARKELKLGGGLCYPRSLYVSQPEYFVSGNAKPSPDCYAVHFSAFGWRYHSKDGEYPKDCLYEQLKARYL